MISTTLPGITPRSSTRGPLELEILGTWFCATALLPGSLRKTTGFLTKLIGSFSKDAADSSLLVGGVLLGALERSTIHAQLCEAKTMVFWGLEQELEGSKLWWQELFPRGVSAGSNVDDSFMFIRILLIRIRCLILLKNFGTWESYRNRVTQYACYISLGSKDYIEMHLCTYIYKSKKWIQLLSSLAFFFFFLIQFRRTKGMPKKIKFMQEVDQIDSTVLS